MWTLGDGEDDVGASFERRSPPRFKRYQTRAPSHKPLRLTTDELSQESAAPDHEFPRKTPVSETPRRRNI
jgi:hypothetical protein